MPENLALDTGSGASAQHAAQPKAASESRPAFGGVNETPGHSEKSKALAPLAS